MHKYVRCAYGRWCDLEGKYSPWNFIPNDVANTFRQQCYYSLVRIALGRVNSVRSRCSHVPQGRRRNHWDEEHKNYTWVAMKCFMRKMLKCIQFKVKALRKSCVEISFDHDVSCKLCYGDPMLSISDPAKNKTRCNKGLTFLIFS